MVAIVVLAGAATAGALASSRSDYGLQRILQSVVPHVEQVGRAAYNGHGSPDAIQAQYDAARDLQVALEALSPVTKGCLPALTAARHLAQGEIREAEGVDRPSPKELNQGIGEVSVATRQLDRMGDSCAGGPVVPRRVIPPLVRPASDSVFTGRVVASIPKNATRAEVLLNGRVQAKTPVASPRLVIAVDAPPAQYTVEVRLFAGTKPIAREVAHRVWLLPHSASNVTSKITRHPAASHRLAVLARRFNGYAGVWIENLATGWSASWAPTALFPAASTVKLGVLIAALKRWGPRPEASPAGYDMASLAHWSSNLAANRLLTELGGGSWSRGVSVVESVLHHVGARQSTYPGPYIVGTAAKQGQPTGPPGTSGRVTTAHDLARLLFEIDAAAMGRADALKTTGLTRHEAEVGLGFLLSSQPIGDNVGLFRPWLGRSFPMAQKNGWISEARHTAAVLFSPDAARIVVVLTDRQGLSRAEAAQFARPVLKLALAH